MPESGKSAGTLTEKNLPRKIRLQERAADVAEHIREAGGSMPVVDLERGIRRGLTLVYSKCFEEIQPLFEDS